MSEEETELEIEKLTNIVIEIQKNQTLLDAKVNWIKARLILISKKLGIGTPEEKGWDLYE